MKYDNVDLGRIEKAVREILIGIGEDPDRDGLVDTPSRVVLEFTPVSVFTWSSAPMNVALHDSGFDRWEPSR